MFSRALGPSFSLVLVTALRSKELDYMICGVGEGVVRTGN